MSGERRPREAPRLSRGQRALLFEQLRRRQQSGGSAERIPRRPPGLEPVPASFAQERLWFLDRLEPGGAAFNIPLALRIQGELAPQTLAAVLGEVVRRHEALRTTFRQDDGQPVQVIAPPGLWRLAVADLAGLPPENREPQVRRLAADEAGRPFDLARGPLLRAVLLRLGAADQVLLLTMHHIISDGWSMGVLVSEVTALFKELFSSSGARRPALPELPLQYADFAVWQRGWLRGEVLDKQVAYWRQRLAGLPPSLDLPADRPRPAAQTYRGAHLRVELDPGLARSLGQLAREAEATLFMVVLAGFQILLGRWTGQEDLAVGSPIANRNRAEIEPLIGFFVNTLVMRGDVSGEPSVRELLGRVRRTTLDAYAHQDLPFERLVEELRPERHLAVTPLYQVVCAVQNAPGGRMDLPGLSLAPLAQDAATAQLDLELHFWEHAGALALEIAYSTELFDRPTPLRLARHLESLLRAAAAAPELRIADLPLFSAGERHQLLCEWSDTRSPVAGGVVELFASRAARVPQALAVAGNGRRWTYCELAAGAARLASALQSLGVGPEVPVGLLARRSPELVLGALAILAAGGAYAPLDPSLPPDRLAAMCRAGGLTVLLSAAGEAAWAPAGLRILRFSAPAAGEPAVALRAPQPPADQLAYVIHTSGSTGRPKAVQVSHGGLANLVRWHLETYGVTAGDRAALVASPGFDAAVWEVWPYLAAGASLYVPAEEDRLAPELLLRWLAAERITLCFLPTPLAEQVIALAERDLPRGLVLRFLLTGGDRLQRAPRCALPFAVVNHYGPTESSVVATAATVAPSSGREARPPVIGRPIRNTRAYVVDARGGPAAAGIPGELALAGAGLSRGYRGRPELTAERFRPDPFAGVAGERLYLTGDVVRRLPAGPLDFLGRGDAQVKLRGLRIELGEIESALARHARVGESIVVLRDAGSAAGPRLVAYVVPRPPQNGANADSAAASAQHVAQWRDLYEETYGQRKHVAGEEGEDPTFDIQGWNSSYSGAPIPAREMREWVDRTVERLLALPHRRVREVGCGTGLLLYRAAPHAERYAGVDFSRTALDGIRRVLASGLSLPQVELTETAADDWSAVAPREFDLVVLNSVVQYFPGVDYLVQVLGAAVRAVAPGGAVFVGDVRSRPLLQAFYRGVELHQAPGSRPAGEVRRRAERRAAEEEELVLDPALFLALARRLPQIRGVEILLKRGRCHNELTRFRYDVVLHVGSAAESAAPVPRDAGGWSLADFERLLAAAGPSPIAVRGLGNARLATERALDRLLAGDRDATAAEALRRIIAGGGPGVLIDPEELWRLGDRLGWSVALTVDPAAPFEFGAVFHRHRQPVIAPCPEPDLPVLPWSAYANDPLASRLGRGLASELRGFLRAELPDYMVPSAFVLLPALPVNAHGKVDTSALPEPLSSPRAGTPPHSPLEEELAALWRELLGVDHVSLEDNFFELGGHSLLATQLVSRLRSGLRIDLPLRRIFEQPTLGGLAAAAREAGRPVSAASPAAGRGRSSGRFGAPLSFAQELVWSFDQRRPGNPAFNVPLALRLRGPLAPQLLERALRSVRGRQGSLRTRFAVREGSPVQLVEPPGAWHLPRIDLAAVPGDLCRDEAHRLVTEDAVRPFDLRRGPLFRPALLVLGGSEHILLLTCHHIISDGWSTGVLIRELATVYAALVAGVPPLLPGLPVQYVDFATEQRERMTVPALAAHASYWRRQLAAAPASLTLPLDRPRPAMQTHRGGQVLHLLSAELLSGLESLSRSANASLFMTLLAALALLLQRWSGQDDVVIGSPVAGRDREETEGLIGFFLSVLPLRIDLSGRPTFRELLLRVRRTALDAYAHQEVPFERMLGHPPNIQVALNLLNLPEPDADLPAGLSIETLPLAQVESKYDFTLYVQAGEQGLACNLVYCADLFARPRMEELLQQYERLLEQAAGDPEAPIASIASIASVAACDEVEIR